MTSLVFVGGGPKTTGVLLAIAAAAQRDRSAYPPHVDISVIDPFPAGGGRIWRTDQPEILWMNSRATDITIYADAHLDPTPIPGPSLDEWSLGSLGPEDFAPRRVLGDYLADAFATAVDALPDGFSVTVHRARATSVAPCGEGFRVTVRAEGDTAAVRQGASAGEPDDTGSARTGEIWADALVLAQGFIEVEPDVLTRELTDFAGEHGLTYIPPGYTADIDLSFLQPGQDVVVRGMGLAFIDAVMLLTEGRGGSFTRDDTGALHYVPVGNEPILWAGSGRGVPYKSKLGYLPEGMGFRPLRYITPGTVDALRGQDGFVSVEHSVLPLLEAELAYAHYRELTHRHPERVSASEDDFTQGCDAFVTALTSGDEDGQLRAAQDLADLAARSIPDPRDRSDLAEVDRPLQDAAERSAAAVNDLVARHIEQEARRAADPRFSQDSAVFHALVAGYMALRELVPTGIFSALDRIRSFDGQVHGLFSYIASGPPPARLEALLALHEAGIVRFLGPDITIGCEAGEFTARSSAHPEVLRATALLDARLAPVSAAEARDPLLRGLTDSGALLLEAGAGRGAKFVTDTSSRALNARGVAHPGLFLVGPSVAGSVGEAVSRPGINSRVFRDNARLAEELRVQLRARASASLVGVK